MFLELGIRVEVGGVARDVHRVRATEVCGTERYGRCVSDLDVELIWRRQDTICGRGIRKGVSRFPKKKGENNKYK